MKEQKCLDYDPRTKRKIYSDPSYIKGYHQGVTVHHRTPP